MYKAYDVTIALDNGKEIHASIEAESQATAEIFSQSEECIQQAQAIADYIDTNYKPVPSYLTAK